MLFPNRLPLKKKKTRLASLAALLLGTALLASCGGGDQKETFHADRVVVFGDEASLVNSGSDPRFPRGSKFTVNVLSATDPLGYDCASNPIWVQAVASYYGHSFDECRPVGSTGGGGVMRAVYGAKVADVKGQIDAYLAGNTLNPKDLVTLMAGTNDILALFNTSPRPSRANLMAAAGQAGTLLGDQVFRVTALRAKVLISNMPDLALTPLGRAAPLGDQQLLHDLSTEFNDRLNLRLGDDPNGGGRSGALLKADDDIAIFVANVNNQFGFTDVVDAACTTTAGGTVPMDDVDLPVSCSTTGTHTNPAFATWLWAGETQLGPLGHGRLGERAQQSLRRNPL